MFYRTRNTVRGTDGNRQVLFKFGGYPWAMIMFKATSANLFYSYLLNGESKYYTSSASNVDDQKWHHIAVVVDGTEGSISFYVDYVLDHKATGTLPEIVHGNSLFVGSKQNGEGQWYDGWIDDIRVMRRALAPSEFLTTRPVGTGDASLLALFENNYAFTCSSNEVFSVSGRGEARDGGNEPTFVKDSRGDLLLDGTNGVIRAVNQYSVSFDKSRVIFPASDLFEAESYTVEFWARFIRAVDTTGAVEPDAVLSDHAPIIRLTKADSTSSHDWYFYRSKDDGRKIALASQDSYRSWTLPNLVVDGRWHHYAFSFTPNTDDDTKTSVQLFYDYQLLGERTVDKRLPRRTSGHNLVIGEGSKSNIQFEMDVIRFSKGVLSPSLFLGRVPKGLTLLIR
jgi:hypothetical protein